MRDAWDDGKGPATDFGDLKLPSGIYVRPVAKPGVKANVGHIAFAMPDFMKHKMAMKAEFERRALTNQRPDAEVGWITDDANGYMLERRDREKPGDVSRRRRDLQRRRASAECKDASPWA